MDKIDWWEKEEFFGVYLFLMIPTGYHGKKGGGGKFWSVSTRKDSTMKSDETQYAAHPMDINMPSI
jgi:hypothetical protein